MEERLRGRVGSMSDGTPGGIAFAAPRLGVPGRSAPRERTPDPQVRSQREEPETPPESPEDPSPSRTEPE